MKVVSGDPDSKPRERVIVERQNLSMRMNIHRFTRLTNAFSKKIENHAAAVAIWLMYYSFCRVHSTLRVAPGRWKAGCHTMSAAWKNYVAYCHKPSLRQPV